MTTINNFFSHTGVRTVAVRSLYSHEAGDSLPPADIKPFGVL